MNNKKFEKLKEDINNEDDIKKILDNTNNKILNFKDSQITPFLIDKNSKEKKSKFNNSNKEFSSEELKNDIKNLKLETKKLSLEYDKNKLDKRIKKKYQLKFRDVKEVKDENDNTVLKNKLNLNPIKKTENFKIKPSASQNILRFKNDVIRRNLHNKISKDEDNNTLVKSLHTIEKLAERNIISFARNTQFRKIKKHSKLEHKINNIEHKKALNDIKFEYKNDKSLQKKAIKNQIKKNKYKKLMMKRINKVNTAKKIQNTISNILAFKSNPLIYLVSFKGILISIALFVVIILFSFISMFFSANQGIGNIYEIQKAELYYRELEATNQLNTGQRLDHSPIDLASFLVIVFGEFTFDENIENFLKEEVFEKQKQGKEIKQIISDSLTTEQYNVYLELYENKLGFIKYGSPFKYEYEPYITSYIGYRINPTSEEIKLQLHKGLDIGANGGTEILAISDGIVTRANFSNSYGNIVEILHDDGYISKYAHQQRLNVTKGQRVSKGDVIGYVGSTGDSTGNHLHLELYNDLGTFMNPIYFIERSG